MRTQFASTLLLAVIAAVQAGRRGPKPAFDIKPNHNEAFLSYPYGCGFELPQAKQDPDDRTVEIEQVNKKKTSKKESAEEQFNGMISKFD